jgi:hypothetical protein
MTVQEIQERNKEIAAMLGFKYKNQSKYWGKYPLDNNSFLSKLGYLKMDSLQFHSDWNWLMEAVEFVKQNFRTSYDTKDAKINEYFIDEWEFKVNKYYVRLIRWTENGWKMFDESNRHLSFFYIIGENCQSEKEAVFMVISDFAKLYNNKEL